MKDDREFIQCKSRSVAKRLAPWAAVIVKREGGYIAFHYIRDYREWRMRK